MAVNEQESLLKKIVSALYLYKPSEITKQDLGC